MVASVEDDFNSIVFGVAHGSTSASRSSSPAASDVGMEELPGPLGVELDADLTKNRRGKEIGSL